MIPSHPTGLGEPHAPGKLSLFKPPRAPNQPPESPHQPQNKHIRQKKILVNPTVQRIRTTLDLTPQALTILQDLQHKYRLRTGKALPSWKVIGQALEALARASAE